MSKEAVAGPRCYNDETQTSCCAKWMSFELLIDRFVSKSLGSPTKLGSMRQAVCQEFEVRDPLRGEGILMMIEGWWVSSSSSLLLLFHLNVGGGGGEKRHFVFGTYLVNLTEMPLYQLDINYPPSLSSALLPDWFCFVVFLEFFRYRL